MAAQEPRFENQSAMPAPFDTMETVAPEKEKDQPEFRIKIWPPEALPNYVAETECITDSIAALIKRDQGDNSGNNVMSPRALAKVLSSSDKSIKSLPLPDDITATTKAQQPMLTKISNAVQKQIVALQLQYAAMPYTTANVIELENKIAAIIAASTAQYDMTEGGVAWSGQPEFDDIYNLQYVELTTLYKDGASSAATKDSQDKDTTLAGFCLKPNVEPYNCVFPVPAGSIDTWRSAQGKANLTDLEWVVKQPTGDVPNAITGSELATNKGWESIQAHGQNCTGIQFARQLPNQTAATETKKSLPANQQFEFEIEWQGTALNHYGPAGWRLSWGGDTYSIIFRGDKVPAIDRKQNGKWVTWRMLEGADTVDFSQTGVQKVVIGRLAGKMTVNIGNKGWCIADARKTAIGTGNGDWAMQECKWPSGKLRITTFGALFSMRSLSRHMFRTEITQPSGSGASKNYHYAAEGKYWKYGWGLFARRKEQLISSDDTYTASYEKGGWHSSTAWIKLAGSVEQADIRNGFSHEVYYVTVLRSTQEGIDTPFISTLCIGMTLPPVTVDVEPIDVGPCFVRSNESSDEPNVVTSADWNIELSPDLLDLEFGVDDEGNGNWFRYVQHWNIIEFAVRWRYTDGTYGNWVTRLRGYITAVNAGSQPGYVKTLSLQAQPPMFRLTGNNGLIDHHDAPMDFHFAAKKGEPFFGSEAIYQILKTHLGAKEANRLNGNTTGNEPTLAVKQKYFAPFHYPLISGGTDAGGFLPLQWQVSGSPTSGGMMFRPPYGQSAISWLMQFANYDFGVCYYGFPGGFSFDNDDGTGDSVCPIYGHYYTLMKDRPTWRVADANYVDGDVNVLLQNATWSDLPEWQITEVQIWSNPPGASANNLPFPSIIQGGARLDASYPGSDVYSWPRKLIQNEPMMFLPGAAEALAANTLSFFKNEYIRRVSLEFPGEARMGWGDKIVPMMVNYQDGDISPKLLKMNGEKFRVIRIHNRCEDEAAGVFGFMTTANCGPYNEEMEG